MRVTKAMRSSLLIVGLLSGCATLPNVGPRPALRGVSTLNAQRSFASTVGEWPRDDWWTQFGDAELDRLIADALRASPDVAIAAARVRASEALAAQANAALGPALSVEGSVAANKQSENLGIPPQFVPDGIRATGRLAASGSFDLDLWGRNRAALAAARGEADAALVDLAQARLLLTTGIVAAYADLGQYHAQRDVARRALRVREATARLTSQRVAAGVDTRGSQAQADARVPGARGEILGLDEVIALTENRLAALAGSGPDRGRAIGRPALRRVPIGLPADAGFALIGRRPDLVAARLRAEAAADRIDVARADFYPDVNLTALVGLQSLGLGDLFRTGSTIGNIGPAFRLPIFDGGRIRARYRGARAEFDTAVARYDGVLVTALREVADAVAGRSAADARVAEQRRAVAFALDAQRIARLRYQGGLSNQLPVLVADDTLIQLERGLIDLEARRTALDVALIRALGGGYRRDVVPSTQAGTMR